MSLVLPSGGRIVILTGAGHLRRERARHVPRRRRDLVALRPGGGRHARGLRPRPRAGPRFLQRPAGTRRAARPNAGAPGAGPARARWPGPVAVVTQNIDDLHERGGPRWCCTCTASWPRALRRVRSSLGGAGADAARGSPAPPAAPARAARRRLVRRDTLPHGRDHADLRDRRTFSSAIGTSGSVYPAAGFVQDAARAGAQTLELNLEASEVAADFDEARYGPAGEIVPAWVEEALRRA